MKKDIYFNKFSRIFFPTILFISIFFNVVVILIIYFNFGNQYTNNLVYTLLLILNSLQILISIGFLAASFKKDLYIIWDYKFLFVLFLIGNFSFYPFFKISNNVDIIVHACVLLVTVLFLTLSIKTRFSKKYFIHLIFNSLFLISSIVLLSVNMFKLHDDLDFEGFHALCHIFIIVLLLIEQFVLIIILLIKRIIPSKPEANIGSDNCEKMVLNKEYKKIYKMKEQKNMLDLAYKLRKVNNFYLGLLMEYKFDRRFADKPFLSRCIVNSLQIQWIYKDGKIEDLIKFLRKYCFNDIHALEIIALTYSSINDKRCIKYGKILRSVGSDKGNRVLGDFYGGNNAKNNGIEKLNAKARKFYYKGIKKDNDSYCYFILGYYYLIEKNIPIAVEYFKKSADNKNYLGKLCLYYCHLYGIGVDRKDQSKIREILLFYPKFIYEDRMFESFYKNFNIFEDSFKLDYYNRYNKLGSFVIGEYKKALSHNNPFAEIQEGYELLKQGLKSKNSSVITAAAKIFMKYKININFGKETDYFIGYYCTDYKCKIKYYEEAAKKNYYDAMIGLVHVYNEEKYENFAKIERLCTYLIDKYRNLGAMVKLADCYYYWSKTDEALRLYKRASDSGGASEKKKYKAILAKEEKKERERRQIQEERERIAEIRRQRAEAEAQRLAEAERQEAERQALLDEIAERNRQDFEMLWSMGETEEEVFKLSDGTIVKGSPGSNVYRSEGGKVYYKFGDQFFD